MSSISRPSNYLLQTLPLAEFEALRPRIKPVEMVRNAVLAEAGRPLNHVYLPHAGIISLAVSLSEGQMVEIAMVGRDGMVGAAESLGDGISVTDAVVLFPGPASMIEIADFKAMADQSAAFRGLLARHERALFLQAQQSVACNAAHCVEARMSRWLLHAHELWDGETLPMTQELLARMIGVQRNAISIVAHALQQAGTIGYSRGQIEIKSLDGLRRSACECYHALRTRQEQLFRIAR